MLTLLFSSSGQCLNLFRSEEQNDKWHQCYACFHLISRNTGKLNFNFIVTTPKYTIIVTITVLEMRDSYGHDVAHGLLLLHSLWPLVKR